MKEKHIDGIDLLITEDEEEMEMAADIFNLLDPAECAYCNETLDREDIGGILPLEGAYVVVCDSFLCLIEYQEDRDDSS